MNRVSKKQMDEARAEISRIMKRHRPRPVMGPFYDGSRKYYVRKKDVTYWDLQKMYPPKPVQLFPPKHMHIFQRRHHLTPHRIKDKGFFRSIRLWIRNYLLPRP